MKARLIQRIKRTPTIESFRFLSGEKGDFVPGQFTRVIFDKENEDNRELNKYLSFSCSPLRDYIEVTKRLTGSLFSLKLKNLSPGEEAELKPAMGNCVFKEEYKKISFLIGGIGITPVISIIEYVMDKGLDTNIVLMYSNRTEEEIAFRSELDRWKAQNSNISVYYVVTDSEPRDNSFIKGMIDQKFCMKKMTDMLERVHFIFGPPKMVEAMKELCIEAGCKKEQVKTESFIGY